MQPEICEEEEVKSPVVGKFKSVEVKQEKQRWMNRKIFILYAKIIIGALLLFSVIFIAINGIGRYMHPSLIILPADDVARLIQATVKFNTTMKPINDEFNAVTNDIVLHYGILASDKPAVTGDGLLLGWVRADGTVLDLQLDDRGKLAAAKAKADSAAAEPIKEYNAINLEVAKRNGAAADYEPITDTQRNVIAYRAPTKK